MKMTDKENNNDVEFENHHDKNHKKRKSDTITIEVPRKLFMCPDVVTMIDRT